MKFFDLHCDTAYESYKTNQPFMGNSLAVDLEKSKLFEEYRAAFAIWLPDDELQPYQLYQNILTNYKDKIGVYDTNIYLSVENASFLSEDIERLPKLANEGVRSLTLTWNGKNGLASGAHAEGGLTDKGREVICQMNRMGMALDLSHLNDQSLTEAIELADVVFASHTACRSVIDVKRNLTDEAIIRIVKKGGLIGLCFYPRFIGNGPIYSAFARQLKHLLQLGVQNHIAIGSDFDGADMDKNLSTISQVPLLKSYLAQQGLDHTLLNKIFYENSNKFYNMLLTNHS